MLLLYSLNYGLFSADDKTSLITRTKQYHFVMQLFQSDKVVLLDSQRTSLVPLALKAGLGFMHRKVYGNLEFAAVNLQAPETYGNPVLVHELTGDDQCPYKFPVYIIWSVRSKTYHH